MALLSIGCLLFVITLARSADRNGYEETGQHMLEYEVVQGKTKYGDWGRMLMCVHGVRVVGFRLKVQQSGMTAIQIACADGTYTYESLGTSGTWQDHKYCSGKLQLHASQHVTGFKFRSDDITGGQNVAMLCNEGTEIQGATADRGTWDSNSYEDCPKHSYFCGVQRRGDDNAMNQIKFLCCKPKKDVIITKSIIMGKTEFGEWSKIIMCDRSGQVSAFRLKVEDALGGGGDDSGLNGIQLFCKDGSATERIEGSFGSWKAWQFCDTQTSGLAFYNYVTGFNFKSEKRQYSKDDTGGNNVKFLCNNNRVVEGLGTNFGTWDSESFKTCPRGSFLCGVQAKIEANQHEGDDTSVNQIKFICCKVENEVCPVLVEPVGCFRDQRSDRTMGTEILNERDPYSKNFLGDYYVDWHNFKSYLTAFRCRCAMRAAALGYQVFGIQFYGECWTGRNSQNDYDKHGPAHSCVDTEYKTITHELSECPVQTGVANSNFVYQISSVNTACRVAFAPIGCFEDKMDIPRPVPNYDHN